MRPHLILDFRERTLFVLVMGTDRAAAPLTFEENGTSTRYLSCDVLLEQGAVERDDFDWEEAGDLLAGATGRNLFGRTRRLGIGRPWAPKPGPEAIRLRHPLWALSAPEALSPETQGVPLARASAVLTSALLEPLFSTLSRRGLCSRGLRIVAIVPPHLSRSARLVLHKVFVARGFTPPTFLPRDLAAAMLPEGEVSFRETLVVDIDEEDLHLCSVQMESDGQARIYRSSAAHVVAGWGWAYWTHRLVEALHASGRLSNLSAATVAAFDRAWAGLAGGSLSTEIPGEPPLWITQSLLSDLLAEGLGDDLRDKLRQRLPATGSETALRSVVALCAALPLQDVFLDVVAGRQPAEVSQVPPLERCARGAAATLRWLDEDPRREIALQSTGSLRINNLHGDCLELVAADDLPHAAGEHRRFKRLLRLEGEPGEHRALFLNLLWGNSNRPEGNRQACALPLDRGHDSAQTLEVTMHLRRSRNGRDLRGTVRAGLGSSSVTGRLRIDGEARQLALL